MKLSKQERRDVAQLRGGNMIKRRSGTYSTQLYFDTEGYKDVLVHYTVCPFCKGSTDGKGGPKIEPDEPAHIEIDWAETLDEQKEVDLSKGTIKELENEIGEWLHEEWLGYMERD